MSGMVQVPDASHGDNQKQRRIWMTVRQALLMIANRIEKEYGLAQKAGAKLKHSTEDIDDT